MSGSDGIVYVVAPGGCTLLEKVLLLVDTDVE
jgi:hypothetical protein